MLKKKEDVGRASGQEDPKEAEAPGAEAPPVAVYPQVLLGRHSCLFTVS